jgi:hypothetical protein
VLSGIFQSPKNRLKELSEMASQAIRCSPLAFSLIAALLLTFASLVFELPLTSLLQPVRFIDGDDALRLAQVRDLLAGGNWFHPTIASFGDGSGLSSHWSRLLDAGIAGLILILGIVLSPDVAEHWTLVIWPKLLLFVFSALLVWQTLKESSRTSALILILMIWLSFFALIQFRTIRIDHHNLQNACLVLAVIMATRPKAGRQSVCAAGLIAGFGLAIGYEALPMIAVLVALLVLSALVDFDRQRIAEGFVAGLAVSLAATFATTTAPSRWLDMPCDALGLNVVAGAIITAGGVFLAGAFPADRRLRGVALAATGITAIAIMIALEPRCLAGPFGKIDPAMNGIWLDHVKETRSILAFYTSTPDMAIGLAVALTGFCLLQAFSAFQSRKPETIIRLVMLVLMTAFAFRYMKMVPYAHLFGLYCASLVLAAMTGMVAAVNPRILAASLALVLSPVTMSGLAGMVLPAEASQTNDKRKARRCHAESDFAALAALPRARILPQQDMGAFFSLMAQHQSMIGNYHRLDREILRGKTIFHSNPEDSRPQLAAWNIDIIAWCHGEKFYNTGSPSGSLAHLLETADTPPDWLEPIDMGPGTDVRAYRVRK